MTSLADDDITEEFVAESRDHLSSIDPDLLAIEKDPSEVSPDVINRIFRAIHSIKGAAGFFGFDSIKDLAHAMESVLMQVRDGKLQVTPELMDPLFSGVDRLKIMVDDVYASNSIDISGDVAPLNAILRGGAPAAPMMMIGAKKAQSFEVSGDAARSALERGMKLYQLRAFLHEDLHNKWDSPLEFLNEVLALGELLDAGVDLSDLAGLEDTQDLTMSLVLATSTGVRKISKELRLPQSRMQQLLPDGTAQPVADEVPETVAVAEVPAAAAPTAMVAAEPVRAAAVKDAAVNAAVKEEAVKEAVQAAEIKHEEPVRKPAPAKQAEAKHEEPPRKPAAAKETAAAKASPPAEGARRGSETSQETLRIRVDLLTKLMNLAGELVLSRNQLMRALDGEARESGLGAILQNISQVTTSLQEGIMQTRMQPADPVFSRFPRIIRDMSKLLGKQINLEVQGGEVELDKSLIEGLTDPLTHIIRNSADHAIEMPDERRAAGKDPTGQILLRAYHQDGHVNISIQDDGKGIDAARVSSKAIEKGIITLAQSQQMTERELVNLIFAPGFSTSDTVSELSGRGVGMDVVRSNTEKMGGTVEVETVLGKGTTILLRLPLTLAIIPSMIVGVADHRFAIPQLHVVEFVSVQGADVTQRIERVNESEVLRLRDRLLPLLHLADVLKLRPAGALVRWKKHIAKSDAIEPPDVPVKAAAVVGDYHIVVLKIGFNHFGVVVDELFDIEEVVVKPTSVYAQASKCFSGATIVGDGHVIMILDVGGLAGLAGLKFPDLEAENKRRLALEKQTSNLSRFERQPIILCTGAPHEYFAIPQESILRLEMLQSSAIQHVGDQEYVNYRGKGLPLLRMEQLLDVRPVDRSLKEVFIVIPKVIENGVVQPARAGIIISSIIDALEVDVGLQPIHVGGPAGETGVMGSAVLDNNLTLFLKIDEILKAAVSLLAIEAHSESADLAMQCA